MVVQHHSSTTTSPHYYTIQTTMTVQENVNQEPIEHRFNPYGGEYHVMDWWTKVATESDMEADRKDPNGYSSICRDDDEKEHSQVNHAASGFGDKDSMTCFVSLDYVCLVMWFSRISSILSTQSRLGCEWLVWNQSSIHSRSTTQGETDATLLCSDSMPPHYSQSP